MEKEALDFKEKYGSWGIVIGASMGIGAACAKRLAQKGLNVIVSARSEEKLNKLKAEIEAEYGVEAMALPLDITQDNAYEIMEEKTKDLDMGCAVFSAAYSFNGAFLTGTEAEYRKIAELNVFGAYRFANYFGTRFCKQKKGGMCFLGSLAGYYGAPGQAFYGGTKAFEIALAEGLYTEFKDYNVDVTVDLIGAVKTPGLLDMFGEEGCAKLQAADEVEVGYECIDTMGTGPVVTITEAMATGVDMMRKHMSLNEQTILSGKNNLDTNLDGFADQFPTERKVAVRLGQKIGQ